MQILKNYNLTKLNTFGISARAKFFVELNEELELKEFFLSPEFKNNEKLFLGGGSNILLTKDFNGIVILNKLKGIEILKVPTPKGVGIPTSDKNQNVGKDYVFVRAMGGEMWHDLVMFAVNRGYWGIENLSLIPGTVGAAPMQNIGAYGAELKDILENVETYEIKTGEKRIFEKEECEFGYRDSVFKNKLKGKYFISALTLKLSKIEKQNISYKILQEYLKEPTDAKTLAGKNKIIEYTPKIISDAVSSIRKSKLPDPVLIGNAGSFFKNVFVDRDKLEEIKKIYPDIPFFEEEENINPVRSRLSQGDRSTRFTRTASNGVKIPAGWLIEKCGWKGKKVGNVGMHEKQALVLINYGGATGKEVKNFSEQIIDSVFSKFGLKLEREVNLI